MVFCYLLFVSRRKHMFCVLTLYRNKCFYGENIAFSYGEIRENIAIFFFNSAYWVIFHAFCRLLISFKINFFEKFFQEYYQFVMSNGLDPDHATHFAGPDLGPNCLKRLSADDTSRQRVNLKQFAQNLEISKSRLLFNHSNHSLSSTINATEFLMG